MCRKKMKKYQPTSKYYIFSSMYSELYMVDPTLPCNNNQHYRNCESIKHEATLKL